MKFILINIPPIFLCKQVKEFQFPVNTIINSHHLLKNVIIWYKENVCFFTPET